MNLANGVTIGQGIPANIDIQWIVSAIVIVIWAGTWLAGQVTMQRKKAALRARLEEQGEAGRGSAEAGGKQERPDDLAKALFGPMGGAMSDSFRGLETDRRAASGDGSASGAGRGEGDKGSQRSGAAPIVARSGGGAGAGSGVGVGGSGGGASGVPSPPDLRKLFSNPKGFAKELQAFAEAQQAEAGAGAGRPSQSGAGSSGTGTGTGTGTSGRTGGAGPSRSGAGARSTGSARGTGVAGRGGGSGVAGPRSGARVVPTRPVAAEARRSGSVASSPTRVATAPASKSSSGIGSGGGEIGSVAEASPASLDAVAILGTLDRDALRRAVVMNEVLQPPVALRRDHLQGFGG